jgi:hypothetical protein
MEIKYIYLPFAAFAASAAFFLAAFASFMIPNKKKSSVSELYILGKFCIVNIVYVSCILEIVLSHRHHV